jgi:hypothetical protein
VWLACARLAWLRCVGAAPQLSRDRMPDAIPRAAPDLHRHPVLQLGDGPTKD